MRPKAHFLGMGTSNSESERAEVDFSRLGSASCFQLGLNGLCSRQCSPYIGVMLLFVYMVMFTWFCLHGYLTGYLLGLLLFFLFYQAWIVARLRPEVGEWLLEPMAPAALTVAIAACDRASLWQEAPGLGFPLPSHPEGKCGGGDGGWGDGGETLK